jgi:hypothetical protein
MDKKTKKLLAAIDLLREALIEKCTRDMRLNKSEKDLVLDSITDLRNIITRLGLHEE